MFLLLSQTFEFRLVINVCEIDNFQVGLWVREFDWEEKKSLFSLSPVSYRHLPPRSK